MVTSQEFWQMIEQDIQDKNVELLTNTEFSFVISIADKKLCFEGAEYGGDCEMFFGKDEIDFYYKLDENATRRLLSLLRIKYGNNRGMEDILKEEFGVEYGVYHFTGFCKENYIPYESIVI